MMYCCSQGFSQLADCGESGKIQYKAAPTTTVKIPSRMKIHLQPERPAMPSIFTIAAAKSPEKAEANEAALKKTAMRVWTSKRQYQQVIRKVAAGKKPDSKRPRSTLVTMRCSSRSVAVS